MIRSWKAREFEMTILPLCNSKSSKTTVDCKSSQCKTDCKVVLCTHTAKPHWIFIPNMCYSTYFIICSSVEMFYHVFHIWSWWVDLPPEFVVEVQDCLHVTGSDGPLASLSLHHPVSIIIQVLLQKNAEICGVKQHHGKHTPGHQQERETSQ